MTIRKLDDQSRYPLIVAGQFNGYLLEKGMWIKVRDTGARTPQVQEILTKPMKVKGITQRRELVCVRDGTEFVLPSGCEIEIVEEPR